VLNGWPTDCWESRKIHVRSAKKRSKFGLKFLRKHNCRWAKQVHLRNARTLYRKGWDTRTGSVIRQHKHIQQFGKSETRICGILRQEKYIRQFGTYRFIFRRGN
jgi:hypothetical protein